jgi:hypothetical protein
MVTISSLAHNTRFCVAFCAFFIVVVYMYICAFGYNAVFVSSRLPTSNFALDNTIYHNVKQL